MARKTNILLTVSSVWEENLTDFDLDLQKEPAQKENILQPGAPNNQKEVDVSPVPTISYVTDFKQAILEQPCVSGWDWRSWRESKPKNTRSKPKL